MTDEPNPAQRRAAIQAAYDELLSIAELSGGVVVRMPGDDVVSIACDVPLFQVVDAVLAAQRIPPAQSPAGDSYERARQILADRFVNLPEDAKLILADEHVIVPSSWAIRAICVALAQQSALLDALDHARFLLTSNHVWVAPSVMDKIDTAIRAARDAAVGRG